MRVLIRRRWGIDIPRLQANLSQANVWPFTPDDTCRWPAFMGFRRDDGFWLTDGRRLERLEPDEILEKTEVGVYELETVSI